MAGITLENIGLAYPLYHMNNRSLRHSLIKVATGGALNAEHKKVVVNALSNVSFSLKEGDKLGLIGHNGAGKSTLLRLLAGIYSPQAGDLDISGEVVSLLSASSGMVLEFTGIENIKLQANLKGLKAKQLEQLIVDVTEFTELGPYLDMPVKTYSSGMLIRLAFAVATSLTAEILLIDEVIGAGDASFRKKSRDRISNMSNRAEIVVMSTHDNQYIREICNKVLWLEHGEMKMYGDVEEIMQQYEANG
tara:strand:+ start:31052 stop:31795 length:744 start_codon:yes stop_codon:yes gene_type:complete